MSYAFAWHAAKKRNLNDLEVNMPSLLDAAEAFSKLGKKSVAIDQAACVRVRHRHASCTACFQVCTHEAIALEEGVLEIANHLCTGCGACTCVCPTGALQLITDANDSAQEAMQLVAERNDELEEAEAAHEEVHSLEISCEYLRNLEASRSAEAAGEAKVADALVVPCLAALDESTAIAAACAGVELHYRSADCATCPNAQGNLIAEVNEQADRLLAALVDASPYALSLPGSARRLGAQWTIVEAESEDAPHANTSPEMSRRGMFDHFARRTSDSIAEAAVGTFYVGAETQREKPALAQSLLARKGLMKLIDPVRNERILNELYRIDPAWAEATLNAADDIHLPTRLFGSVSVSETACDLCGICMTFCPTGALSGVASEPVNSFVAFTRGAEVHGQLDFRANDCVACRLCTDICPHDALEVHRGIRECDLFALEPRTLIKRWRTTG